MTIETLLRTSNVETLSRASPNETLVTQAREMLVLPSSETSQTLVAPQVQTLVTKVTSVELLEAARQGVPGAAGALVAVCDTFTIGSTQITAKGLMLNSLPPDPTKVQFLVFGGIEQRVGVDFTLTGRYISWDALALELLLDVGTVVSVRYQI